MDFGHLLLWIPGLELAELVHHRESVDRQVSGPMCRRLGGNPYVPRRLHKLLRSDGRSLLSGPRGSRHRTRLLPDYRNVLETPGTASPVSYPKRDSLATFSQVAQGNPLGSSETVSQRFSVAWFPTASAISTPTSPAGSSCSSFSAPLPRVMALSFSLFCRIPLQTLYSCGKRSAAWL